MRRQMGSIVFSSPTRVEIGAMVKEYRNSSIPKVARGEACWACKTGPQEFFYMPSWVGFVSPAKHLLTCLR